MVLLRTRRADLIRPGSAVPTEVTQEELLVKSRPFWSSIETIQTSMARARLVRPAAKEGERVIRAFHPKGGVMPL